MNARRTRRVGGSIASIVVALILAAFGLTNTGRQPSPGSNLAPGNTRPTRSTDATPDRGAQRDREASAARAERDAGATGRGYDLRADEAVGGHTIERHVGKTDEELAARLGRERQISAASTYTDLDTAQQAVGAALAGARGRIDSWARRDGARPNLVVNYTAPSGGVLGRSLARGARRAVPAGRALVVLRWHERRGRWYVLTSYPEGPR